MRVRWLLGELEDVEQSSDVLLSLGGVAHLGLWVHAVMIAPPSVFAGHVAALDEVSDDLLSRAFGDSDGLSYVAQAHVAVTGDGEQHLGVVGDERPGLRRLLV
jgi:hypothetical protein